MRKVTAEITVLFTLLMVVFLSFINSMLYMVSIQNSKNLSKTTMNIAVNSVFGEYQKDLLEEYDIFAFETDRNDYVSNISNRLQYYGAPGESQQIDEISFLTDKNGISFFDQAVKSVGGDYLPHDNNHETEDSTLEDAVDMINDQQNQNVVDNQLQSEASVEKELSNLLIENELDLGEDNPFEKLNEWKNKELLSLILPSQVEISNQSVELSEVASHRNLQKGNGKYECEFSGGLTSKLLFTRYLKKHFTCFVSDKKEGALQYELEYMIGGKNSDLDNLKAVVDKLLLIRLSANYVYINTDSGKKAAAKTAALAISGVAGIPALEELVAQGILAVWAYEESVNDIKSLLSGGKVSLMKNGQTWNQAETETGLSYEQYLELLLFLSDLNGLEMKGLDIIEQNMRIEFNHADFFIDTCVNQLKIYSTCNLGQGIRYRFDTEFQYK